MSNSKDNVNDGHDVEYDKLIDGIYRSIVQQFKEGHHQQAARRLKSALERYPDSKKLQGLLIQLKQKVRDKKIQKLETEAVILMQKGAEEEAQKRFREIYRLDPSRTGYKESVKVKLRSEVLGEFNSREHKLEVIRNVSSLALSVVVIVAIFMSWAIWDNHKCLNAAKKCIEDKQFSGALKQLKECGWLFAGEKRDIQEKLLAIISDLESQSERFASDKEYDKAIKALEKASSASLKPTEFEAQLEELRGLKQAEVEAETQAQQAKTVYECAVRESHDSSVEIESPQLWKEVIEMSGIAESLMTNKDFINARKKWIEATQKYNEASLSAKKIIEERSSALLAQVQFESSYKIAKEANAEIEASELWNEVTDASSLANKHFQEQAFIKAQQRWLEASSKCEKALDISRQSPSFQLAVQKIDKWQEVKIGMTDSSVRTLLGKPRYCLMESNKCILYYQDTPRMVADSNGISISSVSEPESGYVIFTNYGLERTLEGVDIKHDKELKKEDRRYKSAIRKAERSLQGDARAFSSEKQEIMRLHQDEIQQIQNDYESERAKIIDGLTAIKSAYVVSSWTKPSLDGVASLLAPPIEVEIESEIEWQLPANWERLKINMEPHHVEHILGGSFENKQSCSFGSVQGYGRLLFKRRRDGELHLDYWKEPFWPSVKEDLAIVVDPENAFVHTANASQ
jgi:tetratricopeptide (TPR) repeat protein